MGRQYLPLSPNSGRLGGRADAERTAALNAADQIAETYVEMVQARAISQFSLEGHSNTMFGHGGLSAGLSGNNRDWQCNCDAWTNLFKNSLKSSLGFDPEATGWDFKAHTNVWKAGDIALGYFWPHNFISVTFDPTGTHPPTPTLIFDPWYRARPDVYAPEDHGQLWQLGWWNTEDF